MENRASAGAASEGDTRKNSPRDTEKQGRRTDFDFAIIPHRAIGDRRMQGLHWHVLAAIAWRDRLGRNGTGCYASYERLADDCNCKVTGLSKAISDLVEWGYVSRTRNPEPKKRHMRVLRVIYKPEDEIHCPTGQGIDEVPHQFPTSFPTESIVPQATNSAQSIVPQDIQKKIGLSPSENDPVETGAPNGAPREKSECQKVAMRLRIIRNTLRGTQGRPLKKGERLYLRHQLEWCGEVEEDWAHPGDPSPESNLGFAAQQLAIALPRCRCA